MRNNFPFPVTPENFSLCWDYVDVRRRKARRKSAIAGIGGFWSNLFLLFFLLFVVNGLIFDQFHGTYHAFLEELPWFTDVWHYLTGLLMKIGDPLKTQVLKLLLVTYGASIAVFALLALLVSLFYHPRKQPVPEGDYSQQTELLAKAAREARNYSYKTRLSTSLASTLLVIVAAAMLLIAYIIYLDDAEAAKALLRQFPTNSEETNCLIYVLIGYFVCGIFSWVLLLLTRPLYRYEFPYDYVAQAESAAIFALEVGSEVSPEKRMADAASLREEAMELEKEKAYARAKALYFKAALCGDVCAMEHYARLCLIDHMNDSARYWLDRCVSSGHGSKDAKSMQLRLKLRLKHNVRYLQPEAAPLTKGQKIRNALQLTFTVLFWILSLLMVAALVVFLIVLLKSNADITVFKDLSNVTRILFE